MLPIEAFARDEAAAAWPSGQNAVRSFAICPTGG